MRADLLIAVCHSNLGDKLIRAALQDTLPIFVTSGTSVGYLVHVQTCLQWREKFIHNDPMDEFAANWSLLIELNFSKHALSTKAGLSLAGKRQWIKNSKSSTCFRMPRGFIFIFNSESEFFSVTIMETCCGKQRQVSASLTRLSGTSLSLFLVRRGHGPLVHDFT